MTSIIRAISVFILLLCVIVAFQSCERIEDPCLEPKTVSLTFKTYVPADTGSAGVLVNLPNAVVGLVDTIGIMADGVEGNTFTSLLSTIADSARIYVWPDSAITTPIDTVTFYYERQLQFISTACGYTYFYSLKDITTTNYNIDSVRIINTEVNTDANAEHVQIFY